MTTAQLNTPMRIYMAVIACLAWIALLLQFPITIATSRSNGMSLIAAIFTYFSFFTILTNLLVAVGLTFALCAPNSSWGSFFLRPVVTSAVAVYIAMVGTGYSLLLRHLWDPEGLQKTVDFLLHDAVPVMYVVYWLIFGPKRGLRWKSVLFWMIYPLAYLSYALVRGSLSGHYPFPFLDAGALGYFRVFCNAGVLLCSLLGMGLLAVAVGKWLERDAEDGRPHSGE
jgi:hypothetical protein